MNARIEAQAGLRATFDPSSYMTFFGGMFDRRWIAQWIPATADFLLVKHPADVSAVIEKIRTRCEEFRNQANDLSMWMLSTPSRIPEPSADLEITGDGSFPQVVFEGIKNAYVEHNRQQHRRKASTYATYIWCLWLPYSAPWLPFALACRIAYPDLFKEMNDEIDCWAFLAHAACGYYFTDNVAFACRKPLVLLMNESRRIHNDKGPSMVWSDRYSVYSWRGIPVERYMIENPGSIKLSRISTEANAELRRTLINIYGEARYLENAGAALIHEDECGQLYQLALKSDEPLCMVKVRNSTPEPDGSFKHYFLRVPPNMSTARQAVAWTFQMDEDEYSPQMQS